MRRSKRALFDAAAAAGRENYYWSTSAVIDGEGKKKFSFDVDLLFHQHGFDGELSNFHRQHARAWPRTSAVFCEGHATNAGASSRPSLNLDNDSAAILASEFFRHGHGFIRG